MPQEIVKDWLRKIKIHKIKNLTVYFRLIKVLLARKIQFKEENSKLDVQELNWNFSKFN
jgi:hypothetical protein